MPLTNRTRDTAVVAALLVCVTAAQPAHAQEQPAVRVSPDSPEHAGLMFGAAALGNSAGAGLELDVRYRLVSGLQLGLLVDGQAASHAFLGGTKAEGVVIGAARLVALFPVLTAPDVEFDFRFATGLSYARDVVGEVTPYRDAVRSATDVAWLAHVPLGAASLLRSGAILTFEMETKPTQALADQALLLTAGFGHKLTSNTFVYGTVDAGGTYGFDGDNGKAVTRGALGLRWSWDGVPTSTF